MIIITIVILWLISGLLSGVFWRVSEYFLKTAEWIYENKRYGYRNRYKPTLTTTWKDVLFYCFFFPVWPASLVIGLGFFLVQVVHVLWMYVDSNPALDKPICNCFETKKEN